MCISPYNVMWSNETQYDVRWMIRDFTIIIINHILVMHIWWRILFSVPNHAWYRKVKGVHYSIRSIYHRSRCILLRVRALIWDSAHNFYCYTFSELIRFFILYYFIVTRTVHLSIYVSGTAAPAFRPSVRPSHRHAYIY